MRPFLPSFDYAQEARRHILITSRNPNWGATAHTLNVQVLPRDQAIEFLLARTGHPPLSRTGEGWGGGDLADALGCLPLALEQAGAYIETNGKTLAEYLQLYRTRQRELLNRPPATDYPATVATTWEISFQQIERQAPASARLLNLLAFFAPDAIPRDIIVAGAEHCPEPLQTAVRDEIQMDEAVGMARRYSLLQVGDGTFSMHRLVQTVTRDRMTDNARKQWSEAAARIVNDAFPFDVPYEPKNWNDCARLLPHALATADYAAALDAIPETTGRLFNQAATYQYTRAQFAEAKQLFECAISSYETAFGSNHQLVATAVNNLGEVLHNLSDLAGARKCYERALTIDEAAFGPNHPNVATDVNNIGSVLSTLGDLAGARTAFERALKIDEATFGPNHPNVATDVNNLGNVLYTLGDLAGARTAFERALTIDEATFGPNHPEVATDVNNLGGVLQAIGDLAGARQCFERALTIDEAAFGPNHPNVATDVNNLGGVLQDLGDRAGMRKCYERALTIDEAAFGPNHPNVATVVNNLGIVLQALGDLAGARKCYERALKIFTQFLPENHPNIKTVRGNLEVVEGLQRTSAK